MKILFLSLKIVILDIILNTDYRYFANLTISKRFENLNCYPSACLIETSMCDCMQNYFNMIFRPEENVLTSGNLLFRRLNSQTNFFLFVLSLLL